MTRFERPDDPISRLYSDDQPLGADGDDSFARRAFADAIASQILKVPAANGFAIGLLGPWGSGKTSVLNRVEFRLEQAASVEVFRFNPWLFSGTEQLVGAFLSELSREMEERATLGKRAKRAAAAIGGYGRLLSSAAIIPIAGSSVAAVGDLLAKGGQLATNALNESLEKRRISARTALVALGKRIVIILDDIDRLRDEEVRDIMRMVRLTADFPNTVYLLAFDRTRVAAALCSSGTKGEEYLEKILQATHTVPAAASEDLREMFASAVHSARAACYPWAVDEINYLNSLYQVAAPFVETARDIRRVLNALPPAIEVLRDEVSLCDIVALETLRVLRPELWEMLPDCAPALTSVAPQRWQLAEHKESLDQFVARAGDDRENATAILERVFPASNNVRGGAGYGSHWLQTWNRDRRVAHADVLAIYLQRRLRPGRVATGLVRSVFAALGDDAQLRGLLGSLDPESLEDLLGRLEDYEDEYPPESVEIALRVLADQWPKLRLGREGQWDFGADMAMGRVMLRLLRRLRDQEAVALVVDRVTSGSAPLSPKLDLVRAVGYEDSVGHELVTETSAASFASRMREQIFASSVESLANERDVHQLLFWAWKTGEEEVKAWVRARLELPDVLLGFLRAGLSESIGGSLGDVAKTITRTIPRKPLIDMVGLERFQQRVQELERAVQAGEVDTTLLDERGVVALDLAIVSAKSLAALDARDDWPAVQEGAPRSLTV